MHFWIEIYNNGFSGPISNATFYSETAFDMAFESMYETYILHRIYKVCSRLK